MSVTDSEANAKTVGLADDVIQLFVDAKVNTLSLFAFSSSYVPGGADERPFLDAMKLIMKRDPTLAEASSLRRLLHESYAMSAAELKQSVERSEDMPTKRLALPERTHRYEEQKRRLSGIQIEKTLEPADRLVDLAVSQYEENRIHHIELSRCISKEQEILASGSKEDKKLDIDASGNVKIKGQDAHIEPDTPSELLLRNAFTRRALAYDQANVVSFANANAWTEELLQTRLEFPPPGYERVSLQQIIQADRKLWVKIADLTRDWIQVQRSGRAVDQIWSVACNHPDVRHLLQPLPSRSSASFVNPKGGYKGLRTQPCTKGSRSKGGKKGSSCFPKDLEGGVSHTPQGHALCFDHNFGKCQE